MSPLPPADGPRLAIIGAGIGGLTLAAGLEARGVSCTVYEQSTRLYRIGAGIQQSPNALRVLRALGLDARLRATACQPRDFVHRTAETGEITHRMPLGAEAETRYGAPYLLLHRGDVHDTLRAALSRTPIRLGKRLIGVHPGGAGIELAFADGSREHADAVIGADGIHSTVRELVFGPQELRYSGRVGYRAAFPGIPGEGIDDNTKWWGEDRHVIAYYITAARDELYLMATTPEPDFDVESWSARGDLATLRSAFEHFHPTVHRLMDGIGDLHKWALADRDPLPRWSDGDVVVMGDAAHPMLPHMGQGAAMAVEDAAVLVRCLAEAAPGDWARAFRRFQSTRIDRTSQMQSLSAGNAFARTNESPVDWLYGYDATTTPLAPAQEDLAHEPTR